MSGQTVYTYVGNDPLDRTDPSGECAQCIYGAIAGAVGGYVSSGGSVGQKIAGVIIGGLVGAAVGSIAPQTSSLAAAAAVNFISGGVSSALGQVFGSATTAAMNKGPDNVSVSDIKVSPVTTAMGAIGSGVGSVVREGIAASTSQAIIGNTVEAAGTPTVVGTTAGAVAEGVITGGAERIAPAVSSIVKSGYEKASSQEPKSCSSSNNGSCPKN